MSRSFFSKVYGVTKENSDGKNRQEIIRDFVEVGDHLTLIHEPNNKYDPNAVAIYIIKPGLEEKIGYINADLSRDLAGVLDAEREISCVVTNITGAGDRRNSFGVNFELTIYTKKETKERKMNPPTVEETQPKTEKKTSAIEPTKGKPSGFIDALLSLLKPRNK